MKVQEEKNEELTMKWKREIAVANGDKSTALAELEQVWGQRLWRLQRGSTVLGG